MRQTPKTVSPLSNQARNTYVVEHLTAALIELLDERPMDGISISELCRLAGTGRASFYRNFGSREDILRAHIKELFGEWMGSAEWDGLRISELVRLIFGHIERHIDFYGLLGRRGLVYLLKDALIELFGPRPEHSMLEAYSRAYVAYTLYGWIEVWFLRGMKDSAEDIVGLFAQTQKNLSHQ